MKKQKKSPLENHLGIAQECLDEARKRVYWAALIVQNGRSYHAPQWHHTILWAGLMFAIGMLAGAGLMAQEAQL